MKINIYKGVKGVSRTLLGVQAEKQLVFIGVNPSKATNEIKDATTKKIEKYVIQESYYGYLIINLYPQVTANPDNLHCNPKQHLLDENYHTIKGIIASSKDLHVVPCWGESIEKRSYLIDALKEIKSLFENTTFRWSSIGTHLRNGHPRHPSRASLKLKLIDFNIDEYIMSFPEIKTFDDIEVDDFESFNKKIYQSDLTKKLDQGIEVLNQDIVNEIVLWKVNRYAHLSQSTLDQLNDLKHIDDKNKVIDVIVNLLAEDGIRLPMASTILRFLLPERFQIIDQRAYRIIYGRRLILPIELKDQVLLYLKYLEKLKSISEERGMEFKNADRILYYLDKEYNRDIKLSNY